MSRDPRDAGISEFYGRSNNPQCIKCEEVTHPVGKNTEDGPICTHCISQYKKCIEGVRSPEKIEEGITRAKEVLVNGDEAITDYLLPLRPGDNPLADWLIEENSRLRQERNDWMREAERLKRWVDRKHAPNGKDNNG